MGNSDERNKGKYNADRKGFETKDGGLIRINGNDKVRIDIYEGNEREKNGHTRDTINLDTNTGKGTIDSHNEDKSKKSSTDINCFLTSACMKHLNKDFDDNCEELTILRWFRDNFVSKEDIEYYYQIGPIIVASIETIENNNLIYDYIYENVILACINAIKHGDYDFAYHRYKYSVLTLEEQFTKPVLKQRLVKVLKFKINN